MSQAGPSLHLSVRRVNGSPAGYVEVRRDPEKADALKPTSNLCNYCHGAKAPGRRKLVHHLLFLFSSPSERP